MAKEREEKAKIDCDADRNNSDYRYQELQHRTGMQGATREFVILLRIRLALVAFDGEGRREFRNLVCGRFNLLGPFVVTKRFYLYSAQIRRGGRKDQRRLFP